MAFFEDLGKKISQTSQDAVQKAKDTAEILKLNGMISEEEKKIKAKYAEIGKKYFDIYAESCDAYFADMINEIKEAQNNINTYNEHIKQLKGITKCPDCGADVASGDAFCTNCGRKITVEVAAQKLCTACGNDVSNSVFCTKCGKKVDADAPASAVAPVQYVPDSISVQSVPNAAPTVQPTATICSNCGAVLAPGILFCTSCGCKAAFAPAAQPTDTFCTTCGNKVEATAAFCTQCGAKL